MQGVFTIVVNDRVSGIAASLIPDDDILFLCQHIRNLTFSFVAPVGAYDCSYHSIVPPSSEKYLLLTYDNARLRISKINIIYV